MGDNGVRRHFGRVAAGYTAKRSVWPLSTLRRQEQAALHSLVGISPGDVVLDAGCGDGEVLDWLGRCGAKAVGIDLADEMARLCQMRGFVVSVQDMEFPGFRQCFDWILCIGTLEFTGAPDRAITNLTRSLRPDGRLAVLFPRRSFVGAVYFLYHRLHGIRIHLFSPRQIEQLLSNAGFRVQGSRYNGVLSSIVIARRE